MVIPRAVLPQLEQQLLVSVVEHYQHRAMHQAKAGVAGRSRGIFEHPIALVDDDEHLFGCDCSLDLGCNPLVEEHVCLYCASVRLIRSIVGLVYGFNT